MQGRAARFVPAVDVQGFIVGAAAGPAGLSMVGGAMRNERAGGRGRERGPPAARIRCTKKTHRVKVLVLALTAAVWGGLLFSQKAGQQGEVARLGGVVQGAVEKAVKRIWWRVRERGESAAAPTHAPIICDKTHKLDRPPSSLLSSDPKNSIAHGEKKERMERTVKYNSIPLSRIG